MDWQTIRIPLEHAIKKVWDGQRYISEETITSGNVTSGFNIDAADNMPSNEVTFYFKNIPENLRLKYWNEIKIIFPAVKNRIKTLKTEDYSITFSEGEGIGGNCIISAGDYTESSSEHLNMQSFVAFNQVYTYANNISNTAIDFCVNKNMISMFPSSLKTSTGFLSYIQNTFETIEDIYLEIKYCDIQPLLQIIYPFDIYAKKTSDITFEWANSFEVIYTAQQRGPEEVFNASTLLVISDSAGNTKTFNIPGSSSSYTVTVGDLYDFEVGSINYVLTSTSNTNLSVSMSESFILVGESDAPDIVSVSQDNYPVVTWRAFNQISWQMIIKQGDILIYDSGMKPGRNQEFRVPVFIEDGAYSIEMRALNNFGLYTGWNSKSFTINPPKPSAPTGIIVSVDNDFCVSVDCNIPSDAGILYVVRRENSEAKPEIVGVYNEKFVDYNVALGKTYEYTVRNYVTGYADGDWRDVTVNGSGAVIRDPENINNYVNIWKSETEFDIIKSDDKSDSLIQCVGRKYPVAELGEWITSTRSFEGCVSVEEYNKLVSMKLKSKHVILQIQDEVLPCYINITDTGRHASGGRNINVVLTRIDGE